MYVMKKQHRGGSSVNVYAREESSALGGIQCVSEVIIVEVILMCV